MAITTASPLPAAQSGTLLEAQFRRLLLLCEQYVKEQESRTSTSESATTEPWLSEAKLYAYVQTLSEQLLDLEKDRPSSIGRANLEVYKQRVKAVKDSAKPPELPAYCKRPNRNNAEGGKVMHRSLAQEKLSRPGSTSVVSNISASSELKLGQSTIDSLTQQEALQELLTDELASMVGGLKRNTLEMQGAVKRRGKLLDSTDAALEDSVKNAQDVAAKSKQQYKRSSGNFCLTCMILMLVGALFSFMIVYIKFTSVLGLGKAPRA